DRLLWMLTTAAFTFSYTSTTSSRRLPAVIVRPDASAAGADGGSPGGLANAAAPTATASPVGRISRRRTQRRNAAAGRGCVADRLGELMWPPGAAGARNGPAGRACGVGGGGVLRAGRGGRQGIRGHRVRTRTRSAR